MNVDTTDIDAQIALLQAEKERKLQVARRQQEKQAREDAKILIASTPGKKDKVKEKPPVPSKQPVFSAQPIKSKPTAPIQQLPSLPQAGPSRMTSSLAALRKPLDTTPVSLSSSFPTQRPTSQLVRATQGKGKERASSDELEVGEEGVRRDGDTLMIVEKLKPGPREFGYDPEGEEVWEFVEPNSGIRLSNRVLPHSTLQDHVYGRYYLPPSLLYSVIRLSRDGATYDVPVDGDWVTIAVVAERGDVKVSGSRQDDGDDSSDEEEEEDDAENPKVFQRGDFSLASPKKKPKQRPRPGSKGEAEQRQRKRKPRKYLNLRLAALPSRAKLLADPTTGPGGDALLQLLLFQSDQVIRSVPGKNEDVKVTYKGGSGGAYEKWGNLNVGDVIGVVSPRVLRPLKSGSNAPHPLSLPLALNPISEGSIFLIGQSKDLGRCSATQKDGNRCRTWVDLRQAQTCEYHIHLSVQRSRSGRAEFTASTSSYSLSSHPNARSPHPGSGGGGINHKTRTRLLPRTGPQSAPRGQDNGGGGATYVVAGKTIRTGKEGSEGLNRFGDERLGEKLGRSRAEKRKRRTEAKEAEEVLGRLVAGGQGTSGAKYLKAIDNLTDNAKSNKKNRREGADKEEEAEEGEERKRPFNADSIKKIGYDPSALARAAGLGKDEKKRKEDSIALLKVPGEGFRFDPRKKVKVVNVRAPPLTGDQMMGVGRQGGKEDETGGRQQEADGDEGMVDLD